jgi:hypothetical protein
LVNNKHPGTRVFLFMNSISKVEDKYYISQKMVPIPVVFNVNSDYNQVLLESFNIIKKVIVPEINKSNYNRHCKTNINDSNNNLENKTIVNICVLFIEDENENINFDKEFMSKVYDSFISSNNKSKKSKKSSEEIVLNVFYGYIKKQLNPNVEKLYKTQAKVKNELEDDSNISFPKDQKTILLINDSNEKFLFKSFTSHNDLGNYISDINDVNTFQDIELGFDYFNDYNSNSISDLFYEEKYFDIFKIIMNAIYSQTQAMYVFSYIAIIILNSYVLKMSYLVSIYLI